ncbi:hypothetical protein GTP45_10095 [Pseudoduganella sp. FT55W]|uniref:Uncharacterized protein n=1 Tax=Duganella rivi TaxID=2666083 RepID=A0A7X4GPE3_9BURK|nr:hypothetical protein [Duganella rivi]MYM67181.1 hypothetical protein [Duganella rivi]
MRPGWIPYALCIPASALIYFLFDLSSTMTTGNKEFSSIGTYAAATIMQSLGAMLGVYLAHRKAKGKSFKA